MASELSRHEYAARYGPTTGDRVRLGDTNLLALIERDETSYGDEVLRGWGKTMRTGLMMQDRLPAASELDLLIANVIVIDPVLGIVKANIGVKDGLIVGVELGTRISLTTPICSLALPRPRSMGWATSLRLAASIRMCTWSSRA